mmetsp:Transcript_12560/g.24548  ORF Transcript_12560/g.24548 Transcript_12560/m.24548 type:complete len:388 (+) Transcript_12560:72-1235(+)
MLTGGSGHDNLEPPVEPEDFEGALGRVRSLLRVRALAKGASPEVTGRERDAVLVERWKGLFKKYDVDGSGNLDKGHIKQMVRRDLRITEKLISDDQLQRVCVLMDLDGDGSIDFDAFMEFVLQKPKKASMTHDEIIQSVTRAVRLSMHRNKIQMRELQDKFGGFCADDPVTGEVGLFEMLHFFRHELRVSKHDVSDHNLKVAFNFIDTNANRTLSPQEFMAFVRHCYQGSQKQGPPTQFYGIMAGSRGCLPERLPRHRPGTVHGLPLAGLPFCYHGRDLKVAHRLGAHSRCCPPVFAAVPPGGDRPTGARLSSSMPILPGSRSSSRKPGCPSNALRDWSQPRRPTGYRTLKGGASLNKIEQRLLEAGLDVRGQCFRQPHARTITHTI